MNAAYNIISNTLLVHDLNTTRIVDEEWVAAFEPNSPNGTDNLTDYEKRLLANALGNLSWTLMLLKDPGEALNDINKAMRLDPTNLNNLLNRAHALMLTGDNVAAESIYSQLRYAKRDSDNKSFRDIIEGDFSDFRKNNISTSEMQKIEGLILN